MGCRLFEFRIERLSLRLILRRVRQRPFVLEHLAEITTVDPAAAGRAPEELACPLEDRRYARLDICRAGSSAELAKLLHHDPAALDFVQAKTCGHFFGGFCTGVPGVLSGAREQTFGAVEQAPGRAHATVILPAFLRGLLGARQ